MYWTLIIIGAVFLLCSLLAAFTTLLSLTVFRNPTSTSPPSTTHSPFSATHTPLPGSGMYQGKRRRKRKRPPLWPVVLLPVVAYAIAAFVALVSGTVVGFSLAAVYSAGGFHVST